MWEKLAVLESNLLFLKMIRTQTVTCLVIVDHITMMSSQIKFIRWRKWKQPYNKGGKKKKTHLLEEVGVGQVGEGYRLNFY